MYFVRLNEQQIIKGSIGMAARNVAGTPVHLKTRFAVTLIVYTGSQTDSYSLYLENMLFM